MSKNCRCTNSERRSFLRLLIAAPVLSTLEVGCKQSYRRPAGDHNLGPVQDLLYGQQIVRDRQMLVIRDAKGWAAMSTQCSHDGCALSYQDKYFLCMCCGSVFDHLGNVHRGPAKETLPYLKVRYADGNLYADSGRTVDAAERYTTPEIEAAIKQLADRIKREGAHSGKAIPDILLGKGDGETGPMVEDTRVPGVYPTPQ